MARGSFEIRINSDAARRQIAELRHKASLAAESALRAVARELLADTRLYVPIFTGALKDSGRVEEFTLTDAIRVARVVFGDTQKVVYAAIQHEVPFNHPSLGYYGAAKYLERPLQANLRFYLLLFAAEYQAALNRRL